MRLTIEQRLTRKGLSLTQARIVAALYKESPRIPSRDQLAIVAFSPNRLAQGITIPQWLNHTRRKLKGFGVAILTFHTQGHATPMGSRDLLSAMLTRHDESPV